MHLPEDLKKNLEKSNPEGPPAIYHIIIAISFGRITASNEELKSLFKKYLTDPTELHYIGDFGSTFGRLFRKWNSDLMGYNLQPQPLSQTNKNTILDAFRLLYPKLPFGLFDHISNDGVNFQIDPGITNIGYHPEILDPLKPEITDFIKNYVSSSKLSKKKTIILLHALFNNNELKQLLLDQLQDAPQDTEKTKPRPVLSEEIYQPQHKIDSKFWYKNFPALEMWRLFMDGDQQAIGWQAYSNREPGCIDKLFQAWQQVCSTMQAPLTPQYFKDLHALCAQGIVGRNRVGRYRETTARFGMHAKTLSIKGYLHYLKQLKHLSVINKIDDVIAFTCTTKIAPDTIEICIQNIIMQYKSNLQAASKKPLETLHAILLFCQSMLMLHPFDDCNGRLFCNLLLNRELIRHGFSPSLLQNPNRIDGHAIDELIPELIEGMHSFQNLKKPNDPRRAETLQWMQEDPYPIESIRTACKQKSSRYGFFTYVGDNRGACSDNTDKPTITI